MWCRLLVLLLKDFGYFEDINVSGVSRIDLISDYNLALIRRLLFEIPLSNFRNFPAVKFPTQRPDVLRFTLSLLP